MIFLDFCNVRRWNLEAISALYEKHKIVHSDEGRINGRENHCVTKHDKRLFYFRAEDIPADWKEKTPQFVVSPDQPEFRDLCKMLRKSQREYRSFFRKCIDGKKIDVDFLNLSLNRVFGKSQNESSFRLVENPENKLKPEIAYTIPYLLDIESYVDWDIIRIALGQTGPEILGHLTACRECKRYVFSERKSKKYCSDECKFTWNNRKDIRSGKRKDFMKRERKKGKYQ